MKTQLVSITNMIWVIFWLEQSTDCIQSLCQKTKLRPAVKRTGMEKVKETKETIVLKQNAAAQTHFQCFH